MIHRPREPVLVSNSCSAGRSIELFIAEKFESCVEEQLTRQAADNRGAARHPTESVTPGPSQAVEQLTYPASGKNENTVEQFPQREQRSKNIAEQLTHLAAENKNTSEQEHLRHPDPRNKNTVEQLTHPHSRNKKSAEQLTYLVPGNKNAAEQLTHLAPVKKDTADQLTHLEPVLSDTAEQLTNVALDGGNAAAQVAKPVIENGNAEELPPSPPPITSRDRNAAAAAIVEGGRPQLNLNRPPEKDIPACRQIGTEELTNHLTTAVGWGTANFEPRTAIFEARTAACESRTASGEQHRLGRGESAERRADSGNFSLLAEHINRNILACFICSAKFVDPKVLPCLHTFCAACLADYTPNSSLSLACPQCGHTSILPEHGICELQDNSFLLDLMSMVEQQGEYERPEDRSNATTAATTTTTTTATPGTAEMEDGIEEERDDVQSSWTGDTVQSRIKREDSSGDSDLEADIEPEGDRLLVCHRHKGQRLRFYCSSCDTAVCSSCTDIEHRDHYTQRLETAMEQERENLRQQVDSALDRVPDIKMVVENVEETIASLNNKEEALTDEINDRFDELVAQLEARRADLLRQLHYRLETKRDKLGCQLKELEELLSDVYTTSQFVDTALDSGTDTQLILVKKQVGERLSSLPCPPSTRPADTDHVSLSWEGLDKARESLAVIGSVSSSSCIPELSIAGGEGLKKACVGKQSNVCLTLRDIGGNPVAGPSLSDITCQIEPQGSLQAATLPKLIHIQIIPGNTGEYDLLYTLPKEGRYRMWIRVYSIDVKDSPFQISCVPDEARPLHIRSASGSLPRPPGLRTRRSTPARPFSSRSWTSLGSRGGPVEDDLILSVGTRGRGKGEFANPQGVAVSPNGRILVSDSNNQCVQVFSPSGVFLSRWGVRGRTPGQLQRPTGITVLKDGNVAVSDYDNKWISIHEPGGKFITKIGSNKFLGPKGLAVNQRGELVAVDNKGSSVYILQQTGKLVKKFGSRGSGLHQFAGPHYPAVNSLGHIVVSDFHNHNIKIFTEEGDYLFSFGSNGEGNGQFNAPTGVAVDNQDNIIVADWGNSRIQVFDQFGSFLFFVNTSVLPLYGPQGIALTPEGNLVVADSGNHCIKLYKYLQ